MLGLLTPIIYVGYNVVIPLAPFIHPGDILYTLLDVKMELLLQFSMCVLWVSGTLAYFEDLGGRGACEFDSYYHYAQPDDWDHVCDLRNLIWPFCFSAFALQVLSFFVELLCAAYIFLFLDQEVLNEPHFSWGRRAYDFQKGRRTTPKSERAARAARPEEFADPEQGPFGRRPEIRSIDVHGFAPADDASSVHSASSQTHSSHSRTRISLRRGQAYATGTPMEANPPASNASSHVAGPHVGLDEDHEAFGSNRERGYDGGTHSASSHEGLPSPSTHGSTTRLPARRGVHYNAETPHAEGDLPTMGTRGKQAYGAS